MPLDSDTGALEGIRTFPRDLNARHGNIQILASGCDVELLARLAGMYRGWPVRCDDKYSSEALLVLE